MSVRPHLHPAKPDEGGAWDQMALSGASKSSEAVSSGAVPFISGHQVRLLVSLADLIQEMQRALELFSAGPVEGGVVQPVRSMVPLAEHGGWVPQPKFHCSHPLC